jgi:glycine C-acetyltransferase
MGRKPAEIERFSGWVKDLKEKGLYAFESPRNGAQKTRVEINRETGENLMALNFSSYNYLGFGYHPEVIRAAQDAVAIYGLGAASSPVISGTYTVHKTLEANLLQYFGMPDRGISLFSSGYGTNVGVIQSFMKPGSQIVMDQSAHMSLLEGAKLSGASIAYFRHNNTDHLEGVLKRVSKKNQRVLVCAEGVYSADGDYGKLDKIVELSKKYGAYVLVDEAHSYLLAGPRGRGACEAFGVLNEVDFYIMTFSKSVSGMGGALLAKKEITQYVNWYANCRLFSCALDPAVTGGMAKVIELAMGDEGRKRRERIEENHRYLRHLLGNSVDLGKSDSWIVTVMFGSEKLILELNDFLQRNGLDTSILQFPAVPKNEPRIRMFVTSEHTREQIEKAAEIVKKASEKFNFSVRHRE